MDTRYLFCSSSSSSISRQALLYSLFPKLLGLVCEIFLEVRFYDVCSSRKCSFSALHHFLSSIFSFLPLLIFVLFFIIFFHLLENLIVLFFQNCWDLLAKYLRRVSIKVSHKFFLFLRTKWIHDIYSALHHLLPSLDKLYYILFFQNCWSLFTKYFYDVCSSRKCSFSSISWKDSLFPLSKIVGIYLRNIWGVFLLRWVSFFFFIQNEYTIFILFFIIFFNFSYYSQNC